MCSLWNANMKISILCVMQNLEIGKYRSFNIMHHKNAALVCIIKFKYPIFYILHHEKSINWRISSFYILHQIKEFVLIINAKYKNKKNFENFKYQAFYNGHRVKYRVCLHYKGKIKKVWYFEDVKCRNWPKSRYLCCAPCKIFNCLHS